MTDEGQRWRPRVARARTVKGEVVMFIRTGEDLFALRVDAKETVVLVFAEYRKLVAGAVELREQAIRGNGWPRPERP